MATARQEGRDSLGGVARVLRNAFESAIALKAFCVLAVAALVIYPIFWLTLGSFQVDPRSTTDLTLAAYTRVFTSYYLPEVVYNTMVMTIGTTILSVLLGVPMAWVVTRTNTPMKELVNLVALIPFITPPIVGAIAWSYLGSPNSGFINLVWWSITGPGDPLISIYNMAGLIWVMALYLTPYTFIFTSIALQHMDPTLENAANVAGSHPISTTFRITLPLAMPAILSGAILVFIQSLEIFAIPAAIGTPGGIYVFVTQIYQLLLGVPPRFAEAAALSMPLLIVCAFALWIQLKVLGREKSYATVGGKSFRPRLIDLGRWRYAALGFAGFYLTMSGILPYLVIFYGTFIKSAGLPPTANNLTLQHIVNMFTGAANPMVMRSIQNSVGLSAVGATIAIFLAAIVAYLVNRRRWPGRAALDFLSLVPVAIPAAVLAIGLLWAYIRPPFDLYGTFTILLLAYITRFLPFGVKAVGASVVQISEELEKAAYVSGATWGRTFRTIMIPIIVPGLVAGWVIMFVSMMKELSASILLYGFGKETLAVALYLTWDEARFEYVSILSLIIAVLSLASIALVRQFARAGNIRGLSA